MVVLKTQQDIEKMRAAGRIVGQTLELLTRMVQPGMSTLELDLAAEMHIRRLGAIPTFKGYSGFPGSVCISVNEEVVHGIPSSQRLIAEGDVVSIDCGATLEGWVGDSAVTVVAGTVSKDIQELLRTTRRALFAGIEKARPGNRLGDISHAVEVVARSRGYGIVRDYCGHGLGRNLHEEPQVPNFGRPGQGPMLLEGWTLAIEPMLNLGTHKVEVLPDGWTVVTADRRPSAHFEHSIAITRDGPVILTLP
jgi:methionyl aminopeptidase